MSSSMLMDFVKVVNRTHVQLDGTFDGIPIVLHAGYTITGVDAEGNAIAKPAGKQKEHDPNTFYLETPDGLVPYRNLPRPAADRMKWQNPQLGTADPESSEDMEFKVAVIEFGDDVEFLTPTDAIELIDRELLAEDRQNATRVKTAYGRRAAKKSRRKGKVSDPKLKNVALGVQTAYDD